MATKSSTRKSTPGQSSLRADYLEAHRWMLVARVLEDKLRSLYKAGKIVGGVYLGRGQEAFSVALAHHLNREGGDVYAPLIRDMAGRIAFMGGILDAVRTYFGSANGPMRGRDGNIHWGRPTQGMLAMISHLGAMIAPLNGMLMAHRWQGKSGTVGAACAGDGATSTGAFHEALNQAAVEKLPLVVAVADNQFAYSTPTSRQFACRDLVDRAKGYGVRGHSCDGTNLEDCLATFQDAVGRARAGEGPQLVVGSLLRLSGHGEHDDASYVPANLRKSPLAADCVELAEDFIKKKRWASAADLATLRSEIIREVEEAIAEASRDPLPDPARESWYALATKPLCEGHPEV